MPNQEVSNTKGMGQLWNEQSVLHETLIAGFHLRDGILQASEILHHDGLYGT